MTEHVKDARAQELARKRNEKTTPEQRKAIARMGAEKRWEGHEAIQKATHTGILKIGNTEIECAVLSNGKRVISVTGISLALGREGGGNLSDPSNDAAPIPRFLAGKIISPFISKDLAERLPMSIPFTPPGGGQGRGYEASILPELCEVWLKARDAGALHPNQGAIARQAEILMRGLAHVGIEALVDEATGYQRERANDALSTYLEKFISKELASWAKTFPDEFYTEMYRLKCRKSPGPISQRPPWMASETDEIVYKRLAPAVREELHKLNPANAKRKRAHKNHQHLTQDFGHPKLREHLAKVIALMKVSASWADFKRKLDMVVPKFGKTFEMQLDIEDPAAL